MIQETSREAYESIKPYEDTLREKARQEIVEAGPLGATTSEIAERLSMPRDSVSPRMKRLVKEGHIYDSGLRRTAKTNRRQIVWMAVPNGTA